MSQQWYAQIDQNVLGPMSTAELKQRVEASEVQAETPLRLGMQGKWIRASKVKGLGFTAVERRALQLADAKAIASATENRRWLTPLTLFLTIAAMIATLLIMFAIQSQRMNSLARQQSQKDQPVMQTTSRIEMSALDVKLHERRNGVLPQELPRKYSNHKDGWERPMKLEPEGLPVSTYRIVSAGEDGVFATGDDIAIRFNMDHEQLERTNTRGLEELEEELRALGIMPRAEKP